MTGKGSFVFFVKYFRLEKNSKKTWTSKEFDPITLSPAGVKLGLQYPNIFSSSWNQLNLRLLSPRTPGFT